MEGALHFKDVDRCQTGMELSERLVAQCTSPVERTN